MNLTGLFLEKTALQMNNKYNINFSIDSINTNMTRLINQCWKLIPMKENDENWEKQLDTIVLELVGLNEIFLQEPYFLQLLSKLEGLKLSNISFEFFRKTVFETISLIQKLRQ